MSLGRVQMICVTRREKIIVARWRTLQRAERKPRDPITISIWRWMMWGPWLEVAQLRDWSIFCEHLCLSDAQGS